MGIGERSEGARSGPDSSSYEAQVAVPDVENAFHHAALVYSVSIWDDLLDLILAIQYVRTETPTRDSEGNLPGRDDLRTSVGVGFSF
jgi:hypothetical protein